jgi:hypothetical protein
LNFNSKISSDLVQLLNIKVAPNIIFHHHKKFYIFLKSLTIFPDFNLISVRWKRIKQNSKIYILFLTRLDPKNPARSVKLSRPASLSLCICRVGPCIVTPPSQPGSSLCRPTCKGKKIPHRRLHAAALTAGAHRQYSYRYHARPVGLVARQCCCTMPSAHLPWTIRSCPCACRCASMQTLLLCCCNARDKQGADKPCTVHSRQPPAACTK